MTDRIKAASISLLIIALITGLKFILYYISGSIAVLSEAWHSFSDIATTLLVLISILRQQYKTKSKPIDKTRPDTDAGQKTFIQKTLNWLGSIDTELKIAGIISMVLLSVSIMILWRAVFSVPVTIEKPLITGIIFVVLSFGSFFLYQFQDTIGREGNSAALRADSLHNRADMAISLLTGASLIIYHFGFDIDRWVSLYIAIFIFSFAVEMLFNVLVSIVKGGQDGLNAEYSFNDIVRFSFRPETYKRCINAVIHHLSLSQSKLYSLYKLPVYLHIFRRGLLFLTLSVLSLGYLNTMIYTVNIDEKALALRFGQILEPGRMIGPGIHWKLPWPIDRVERFQTGKIFSLTVGNVSDLNAPRIWRNDHGDTKTFVSGDNNLFLPYLTIHYRIKHPGQYYLNFRNGSADKMVEYQAYNILSQLFSNLSYFDIALTKRQQWTSDAEYILQNRLDELEAGIDIVAFYLKDLHPPKDIAASYENVVAAYQNREQTLNQAQRYYYTKLPEARSKAYEIINNIEAEATGQLKLAQGEAQHFKIRQQGFQINRGIGKKLLTLEAAEQNLRGKKIFLIDQNSGIDSGLVYFENHMSKDKEYEN